MTQPRVVILTGAGISAESGIETFRGADGLWNGHRVEDVASPEGFARNPLLVQTFYNQRRRQLLTEVEPNEAHWSLAKFERQHPNDYLLVTQNIDDLHERAGSQKLIHMHGELLKARSTETGDIKEVREDLTGTEWRPHIVWFGEMPMGMDDIEQALYKCDLFISIGTSGHVYPAAGFVQQAMMSGAYCVELNLEPSQVTSLFHESHQGPATELVPWFLEQRLHEL